MKKILIVADDPRTQAALLEGLRPYGEFEIEMVGDAKAAARHVRDNAVDLVLTDLGLPEIDGIHLLAFMKKKHPRLPTLAMYDRLTPKTEKRLTALNVRAHFKKPVDVDRLVDCLFDVLEIVAAGQIHGISLASFLQLVDIEQKTCTLKIRSGRKKGLVCCRNGEVVAAETGGMKGKEALYKIMFWDQAIIEITEACLLSERNIDIPLMYLLMESHQFHDEDEARKAEQMAAQTVPEVAGPDDVVERIADLLARNPDVRTFAVFDEEEHLCSQEADAGDLARLSPTTYFDLGDRLSSSLDAAFTCIDINTRRRIRYSLFRHLDHFIVVELNPGTRVRDLVRTIQSDVKGGR